MPWGHVRPWAPYEIWQSPMICIAICEILFLMTAGSMSAVTCRAKADALPIGQCLAARPAGLWLRCRISQNVKVRLEYLALQGQTMACPHHAHIF